MPVIDIEDFSGGLNTRDADHKIPQNEARGLTNYLIEADGGLKTRNGSSKYNASEIGSGDPVHSLYRFYKSASAVKKMLACVDDGIWVGNDGAGTWAEIGASLLSVAQPCTFETWQDLCYFTNGTVFKTYDGSSTANVSGTPPIGKYIALHKERIYVAGVAATPNRLFYCETGDPTTWNTGSNIIDINSDDGDEITGILPLSDFLIIYKRNGIWVLSGNSNLNFAVNKRVSRIGCFAPRSLVAFNNRHYFLDRTGVHVFDSASAIEISGKVQPEIDSIPTDALKENSAATIYKKRYWLSYIPAGETEHRAILAADLRRDFFGGWSKFVGINVASFAQWDSRDDSGEIYAGDSSDGFVWQLDTGSDDGGTDIDAAYQSKVFKMGAAVLLKEIDYAHITGEGQNVIMNLTLEADRGDATARISVAMQAVGLFVLGTSVLGTDSLGTVEIKTVQKAIERLQGYGVSVKLDQSGAITYSISGVGFAYTPLSEDERFLVA